MRNLMNGFVIIFIILFSFQAHAQTFGIKGGLSLANILEMDDEVTYSDDYKMNPGFHLGFTVDMPFNDFLSFEPGLIFTTKGMRINEEEMGFKLDVKANLYYLDVPLTVKATHDLGAGLKLFGAVGPYVGMGLSGKVKGTMEYDGEKETDEEDVNWGSDDDEDDLKRLDAGVTFGGGIEINSVLIGVSYDLGLANISAYQEEGTTKKNRVLKFSVGYRF